MFKLGAEGVDREREKRDKERRYSCIGYLAWPRDPNGPGYMTRLRDKITVHQ